jgi:hypothetical protein
MAIHRMMSVGEKLTLMFVPKAEFESLRVWAEV